MQLTHLCLLLILASACTITACRRKSEGRSNADFERAANAVIVAESAAAPAEGANPAAPPAAQQMKAAVESYKSGQLEDAVTRLQNLRATPVMSPQQRMALNDAIAAVMTDIYAQAANGDPRAVQAVKQYEKMQNQRR